VRLPAPFRAGGGRPASPFAVALLAALSAAAAGCASAPPPAPREPVSADAAFAYRDPRDGAPPPAPSPRDAKTLSAAVDALRRGDPGAAQAALAAKRRKGEAEPPALLLAGAYVALANGSLDEARATLAELTAAHPTWVAAVEAEADLAAAEGRAPDALERYRALARLLPADRRAKARVEAQRAEVAAAKRRDAEEALLAGDLDEAKRAAHAVLQLDPLSASGPVLLSRVAAANGKSEDAWTWAKEARRRAPADRGVAAFAAAAAAKTRRWADAAGFYEELAAADPAFVPKAEEARLEFKVQNLPEAARHAADSTRLTRAQLATLLWWTVPEFRDALVPPGVEIAVDVVDRPDRAALVKAIGLGFLTVSAETHRVGADAPVSRAALPSALRRVAHLSGRGRPPKGCLAPEAPAASALSECGILHETPSRDVTGREALRALEKAARLGREGGTR